MTPEHPYIVTRKDLLRDGISPEQRELDPLRVIQSTHANLELRLRGEVNPRPLDNYFTEVTLPYLDHVAEATMAFYDPKKPVVHSTRMFEPIPKHSLSGQEHDRASVDLFSVIFSSLPENFENPVLPMGYSRRGYLRPPTTQKEMMGRVVELKNSVQAFMSGEYSMDNIISQDHTTPALRTLAFFRVGSSLPVHEPVRQHEREQQMIEQIQEIDLCLPEKPLSPYQQEVLERKEQRQRELDLKKSKFNDLLEGIVIDLT